MTNIWNEINLTIFSKKHIFFQLKKGGLIFIHLVLPLRSITKIFSCVRLFLVDVALVKGVIYSTLFSPYATRRRHSEIDYCIAQVFREYMYFRSMPKVGKSRSPDCTRGWYLPYFFSGVDGFAIAITSSLEGVNCFRKVELGPYCSGKTPEAWWYFPLESLIRWKSWRLIAETEGYLMLSGLRIVCY